MKTKTAQLPATNEILSALKAKKYLDDRTLLAAVKANPAKALKMEKHIPNHSVRTVQNTRDTMNICIPDYQVVRNGTFHSALSDMQMAQISGGETVFTVITSVIGGIAGPAAVVGLGLTLADQSDDNATDGC